MRRRILNTMIAMIIAVGLLLGIPLTVIAWWWVADNATSDLDARLKVISAQLIRQEGADGAIASGALDTEAFAVLLPEQGRLTITYPVADAPDQASTVIGADIEGSTMSDSIALGSAGSLTLEIPSAQVRSDQLAAAGIVAIIVAASVAAGTTVAAITAGRVADPMVDLARRAADMARGDFRSEWKIYDIPELDRVSKALGDANAEIAHRLEREREIVGDVSHQLRSRLTAIQLRLDELTLHDDPAVVAEAEAGVEQVERLTRELEELVAVSRDSEAGPQAVQVRAMVATLVEDFDAAFGAVGRTLTMEIGGDPIAASAGAGRLREAVSVLVDNALQHGAGSCRIVVGELPAAGMVRVTVTDEGDGVPDDLVGDIFRRGFSAGRGNGVGLSLARALVEADGGRLDLQSRHPPTFAIVVPRFDATQHRQPARTDDTLRRGRVPHR